MRSRGLFKLLGGVLSLLVFIFALEMPLESLVFKLESPEQTKSLEDYWKETGLPSTHLEHLLSDKNCHLQEKNFLACANAINRILEKLGKVLAVDGIIVKSNQGTIFERLTERAELGKWSALWQSQFALKSGKFDSKPISFLNLWNKIRSNWTDENNLSHFVALGINGYFSLAKDPHSYLVPLAYYEEVISQSDSRNNNLGFIAKIAQGPDRPTAVIRKVIPGSPADLAGLKPGDEIEQINDKDVSLLTPAQFLETIRPGHGKSLTLQVKRLLNGSITQHKFEVMSQAFSFSSVMSQWLAQESRVGLVTIHKFARGTCRETRDHILSLKKSGRLQGLILDLRDNPGGQVEEAACIASLFLPKGRLLFTTQYLNSARAQDRYFSSGKKIYSGPLVITMNAGSASAAEIVAGALREQGRATLVGERSFGKGTFQDGRVWVENEKVALFETEGFYLFPSGHSPQLRGISPDIVTETRGPKLFREADLFFNPILPLKNPVASSTPLEDCGLSTPGQFATNRNEEFSFSVAEQVLNCRVQQASHQILEERSAQ